MGREDPELKAQESRLGSMNKLLQRMICGMFKKFFFSDDEQLVGSYFVSCVA